MIQGRFNYRIKICCQKLNYLYFTLDNKRVEAKMKLQGLLIHYVKSVQIQSFFWYVFSLIWTEYGDLLYLSNAGKSRPEKTPYLDIFWTLINVKETIHFHLP